MRPASDRSVDLNSILKSVNLLVMALLAYGLFRLGDDNPYIDMETILLAIVLGLQTHIALFFERKQRDPFVILLAFTTILYFSFRIFTLVLYPYSDVFPRFPYDAGDSNYAMIFILIANTCLYLGLYKVKGSIRPVPVEHWRATTPGRVLFLVLVVGLFAYTKENYWTGGNIPQVFLFVEALIYPGTVFLMVFVYCFAFAKKLSRSFIVTIIVLLVVEMVLHSLAGTRGAILGAMEQVMVVLLALSGFIKVPRRYVILGGVLAPALVVLLVGVFFVTTYVRVNRGLNKPLDVGEALDLSNAAVSSLSTKRLDELVLPPVFARAGFFDYSAEIIAHREQYGSVINLPTYFKSIVDNVLTPGFDVFDQPKISNALIFVYWSQAAPSKAIVAEQYHSDQLGLYGELYALFGYASIPLFFGLALSVKRIYVRLQEKDPFDLVLKRAVILVVFGWIINSYGFDWIILETLVLVASVWIYKFFFRVRAYQEALASG